MATARSRRQDLGRTHSRYQPLQFSEFSDQYAPSALQMTPGFPALFPRKTTERWRREMGRFTNQPRGPLMYRLSSGHYDPLAIAAVLDMILRLEIGPYINSGMLTFELNRNYEQINWEPVPVGRILSDIASFASDLKMPSDAHEKPFYLRFSGGARNYIVHNDPNGWQWLGLLRDYFGKTAATYVAEDIRTRTLDVWTPCFAFKYGQRVGES